jgi:dTDP-4-dehydrorhamnose reductase
MKNFSNTGMKKIVVIGADGQLGSELMIQLAGKYDVTGLTIEDLNIVKMDPSLKLLREIKPDTILNTAAYHNVPKCEENPLTSFEVNALGALNLARISEELDAVLVHYSTDYVFDGQKKQPYLETDHTNPLNIYALSKRDGEILINNNWTKHYVLRISGIYGAVPCMAKGGNFITTMKKAARERDVVKVVDDEVLTPTSVYEIAKNTDHLVNNAPFGLYHMTCEGSCSWYEFARVIFDKLKLETPLESCTVDDFPSTVKRPFYSVLENKNLKDNDVNIMKHWKEALISFLSEN